MVILVFVIPAILGLSSENLAHHRIDRKHHPPYRESHSGNYRRHFRCDPWCIQTGGEYRHRCLWDRIQNYFIALPTLYEGSARPFAPRYQPFIPLLILDAPASQQSQQASGVLSGPIRYAREPSSPEIIVRPPSYHSDDEYVDPLASGRK